MKRNPCFLPLYRCLLVAMQLLLLCHMGRAQSGAMGTLSGKVTGDKNAPLHGANIKINGGLKSVVTDPDGNFTLPLTPGVYTVEISYVSYEIQRLPQVAI